MRSVLFKRSELSFRFRMPDQTYKPWSFRDCVPFCDAESAGAILDTWVRDVAAEEIVNIRRVRIMRLNQGSVSMSLASDERVKVEINHPLIQDSNFARALFHEQQQVNEEADKLEKWWPKGSLVGLMLLRCASVWGRDIFQHVPENEWVRAEGLKSAREGSSSLVKE